ncbi:MAG TPA: hypothetical protein VG276_15995 [Actinomycetes bacterium]|nr:hypothetical protein [Actinomycetes bacterium]
MANIRQRVLAAKKLGFVAVVGLVLALGAVFLPASAQVTDLSVEVVSSGCRDGAPYLDFRVTNTSTSSYTLVGVGFVAPSGETAEVTTGGAGYFILQGNTTMTFSPTFSEVYEGQTVTPYVHLFPGFYSVDFVYGPPTTVPTCPGSPPTTGSTTPTTEPTTTVPPTPTTRPVSCDCEDQQLTTSNPAKYAERAQQEKASSLTCFNVRLAGPGQFVVSASGDAKTLSWLFQ